MPRSSRLARAPVARGISTSSYSRSASGTCPIPAAGWTAPWPSARVTVGLAAVSHEPAWPCRRPAPACATALRPLPSTLLRGAQGTWPSTSLPSAAISVRGASWIEHVADTSMGSTRDPGAASSAHPTRKHLDLRACDHGRSWAALRRPTTSGDRSAPKHGRPDLADAASTRSPCRCPTGRYTGLGHQRGHVVGAVTWAARATPTIDACRAASWLPVPTRQVPG